MSYTEFSFSCFIIKLIDIAISIMTVTSNDGKPGFIYQYKIVNVLTSSYVPTENIPQETVHLNC